jgi:hypothetical protein
LPSSLDRVIARLLRSRAAFTGFSDILELLVGEMLDAYE